MSGRHGDAEHLAALQALRLGRGAEGHRPRGAHRRIHRPRRSVRLRQVDAARHDRRAGNRERGRDPHRRNAGELGRAEGPRHRHGVSVLCALPDDDRAPEHDLRHGEPARAESRAGRGDQARRFAPADRAAPQPQARSAFRRPAAARRHGARAGARSEAFPVRRAFVQSRRQAARRHAHRDQEAAPEGRQDHHLRDPRPDRGDDARLPHRRHAPGLDPAIRRAAGRLRSARQHVRRRLHGLAVDEFHSRRTHQG